jgi:hypothetical protein
MGFGMFALLVTSVIMAYGAYATHNGRKRDRERQHWRAHH